MGFWSSAWAGCKSAAKAVSSGVKAVYYKVTGNKEKASGNWQQAKENANDVKTNFVAAGHALTGRDKFEEAEQLYSKITEKYNVKRKEFETEVEKLIDSIEACVQSINNNKNIIHAELFVQMANNLSKIKDIKLPEGFIVEEYRAVTISTDSIRGKDKLFKIDFNKLTFKNASLGILTLGWYTRKKAKQSLFAVKEEEAKINHEIAKMDAELDKMKAVLTSLQNVEHYFNSLVSIYRQLLDRLDNSVHHLYFKCMQFARRLVDQGLSVKFLPVSQQKELEALFTASKILKVMTQTQIISLETSDTATYAANMKDNYQKFESCYKAA